MSTSGGLSLFRKLSYASGNLGGSMIPMFAISWLLFYYTGRTDSSGERLLLVGYGAYALINFISRIIDAGLSPLVGYLSDRTRSRWGRRMPWIAVGAPFMTASVIMLFSPPGPPLSMINAVWLMLFLNLTWFSFTAVIAPYLALHPEISVLPGERMELSSYMGIFEAIGTLCATALVGVFISYYPEGIETRFINLDDPYRLAVACFALAALFFFYFSIAFVSESPAAKSKEVPFGFLQSVRLCFRNRPFVIYLVTMCLFTISIDVLIAVIPFMVTLIIGYEAHYAGYLQGGLVLMALLCFFPVYRASLRFGKKKVFSGGLLVFALSLPLMLSVKYYPFIGILSGRISESMGLGPVPANTQMFIHASGLLLFIVYPLAAFFVLLKAMMADIIDHDERLTEYRREAMYDGMQGLIVKFSAGIAAILAPLSLKIFGDTQASPEGVIAVLPLCSFMLFGAWLLFRKYPVES